MIKKFLLTFLAVIFSLSTVRAEESKKQLQVPKKKVLIYSFVPIDDSGKYIYYSSIIPSTLAKNITMNGIYEAENSDDERQLLPANAAQNEKKTYFDEIAGIEADYAVTGNCEIIENPKVTINGKPELLLKVRIQLFNIKARTCETMDFSSKEVGVILKESIDEISAGIEEKIEPSETITEKSAAEQAETKEPEPIKPSPFLKAPRSMFTFGVEAGEFFILDKWADIFNWDLYVKPYISFNIIQYVGLTLSYDYFGTDNDEKKDSTRSYLEINTVSLGVFGTYRFIKYLDVMGSASVGLSFSEIEVENDSGQGPFSDPLDSKKTIDPSMEVGASIGLHLWSVIIRTGFTYKRYFYSDESLHGVIVYGSLGYNF